MAAPKDQEQAQQPVWDVEGCRSYSGKNYWTIWRAQDGVYGGRAYVMTPNGYDRKRFYDEAKAMRAAEKLNGPTTKGAGDL